MQWNRKDNKPTTERQTNGKFEKMDQTIVNVTINKKVQVYCIGD